MSDPGQAVFLSYASQDAEAAKRICEALRAAGVEVWFDQNELVGGDAWDAKIRKQIAECALFVPVISAATQARLEGYFRIEWKLAARRTHAMATAKAFLLPVVIDATRDAEAHVPDEFREVQWTRLAPSPSLRSTGRQAYGGQAQIDRSASSGPAGSADSLAVFGERVKTLLGGDVGARASSPATATSAGGTPALPTGQSAGRALSLDRLGALSLSKRRARLGWAIGIAAAVLLGIFGWSRLRQKPDALPPSDPAARRSTPSIAETSAPASEIARLRARIVPDRWQKGDFEAIAPALDRLISANPDEVDVWALRSITQSLQVLRIIDPGTKPLEIGRNAAEHALRLAPDAPLAQLALGMHHIAMVSRGGDPLACRGYIDRALAELPADGLTRFAGLLSFHLAYDFSNAERVAKAWLEAEPGATYPAWIMAAASVPQRRASDVEKWAGAAVGDPGITGTRALASLAEMHFFLRANLADCRAVIDRVPVDTRNLGRVILWRWLLAMAERRWDVALQELAQVTDPFIYDNSFGGPKVLLAGLAHQRAGRRDAAAAQFREAERLLREKLSADSENESLRTVLAVALAESGRAAEARSELALVEPVVRGRKPNAYRGRIVVTIAQAYGAMGDHAAMAFWLHKLFTEPSHFPLTPASLRLDPRLNPAIDAAEIQALLKEFAHLDLPPPADLGSAAGLAKVSAKSVAVLAFKNLSGDPAREFFSDGLSEAVTDVLGRVPGLKVVGSASAFSFKNKSVPIPEMARQLGVTHLVEGTVLQEGQRVRITAKLIQADGFQVGPAERAEHELKNIFALHDEVAGLIAKNLSLKLGASSAASKAPVNPEAFELYVRARQAWSGRTMEGFNQAERLLTRALALEPNFARAHAALADVWMQQFMQGNQLEPGEQRYLAGLERIREKVTRALELEPESAEAHASLGFLFQLSGKNSEGERAFRRAVEFNANYASAHQWLGRVLVDLAQMDQALERFSLSTELDPLSPAVWGDYGLGLLRAGRFEQAIAALNRALTLQPNFFRAARNKSFALLALGRFSEAVTLAKQLPGDAASKAADQLLVLARAGLKAEAEALFAEVRSDANAYFWVRPQHFLALGRTGEAFERMTVSGLHYRFGGAGHYLWDPIFDPVRNDPRWLKLMADAGLTEAHARAQAWRKANPPEKTETRK